MQHIVGLIVARLQARLGHTATLSVDALSHTPALKLFLTHDALRVGPTDLPFLRQLADAGSDSTAVANLREALSLGMAVCITLPTQALAHLPLRDLAALPCRWCDPQGTTVILHLKNILSYRDLSALREGWLVTSRHTVITPLARETALARHIQLVKQE